MPPRIRTLPFLIFSLLSVPASSAIIQLEAFCTDAPTLMTDTSVSCAGPYASASAQVQGYSISADAGYESSSGLYTPGHAFVRATMDTDLSILATGGTGSAYFDPCLTTGGYDNGGEAAGWAIASLGSIRVDTYPWASTCGGNVLLPITSGVAQTVHLHLESQAYAGYGTGGHSAAKFLGGFVANSDGSSMPGMSVLITEIDTAPEPSSVALIGIGLGLVLYARHRQRSRDPHATTYTRTSVPPAPNESHPHARA